MRLIVLFTMLILLSCGNTYRIERLQPYNPAHLVWDKNRPLLPSDFLGDPIPGEKFSGGIHLEIVKMYHPSERKILIGCEMDKGHSFLKSKNPKVLLFYQTLFDSYEVTVRKLIAHLNSDSLKSNYPANSFDNLFKQYQDSADVLKYRIFSETNGGKDEKMINYWSDKMKSELNRYAEY